MKLKRFFDTKTALFGFKDENNVIKISAAYKNVSDFFQGYAVVEYDKKVNNRFERVIAFVNEQGLETEVTCQQAFTFKNGLTLVCVNGLWKLMDKNFNYVSDEKKFNSAKDVQISDLNFLCQLVEKNGVDVLTWANPNLFILEGNMESFKNSLKVYLKDLAFTTEVKGKKFAALIRSEVQQLKKIQSSKLQQLSKTEVVNTQIK